MRRYVVNCHYFYITGAAVLCSIGWSGGWLEIRGSSQSADSGNEQGTFPLAGNGCRFTRSRANAKQFRILSRLHQRHDFPEKPIS